MVYIIKLRKIPALILLCIAFCTLYPVNVNADGINLEAILYERDSKTDIIYSHNVPIYISFSYSYEEYGGEDEYAVKNKRITSVDSASAVCRSSDYSGLLNASSSYDSGRIYISVYGTLNHKTDKDKRILVNESYSFNI